MNNRYLKHYGVLGMKWGVRRNRNKSGSQSVHDDYKRAHDKKSVKSMSDSDLQSVNRRLNMEKQYADLTKKTGKGKKIVKKIIAVAGTISAAEGAYKTYKKFADKAIDSIGDMVINDLNKRILK